MQKNKTLKYIKMVLENMPSDWLNLTTHRLDVYFEDLAKTQFLEQFEGLYKNNNSSFSALNELPTAYDYIRLGHPLSSVLEWTIAKLHNTKAENIIAFSSQTIPILAVLRKNLLENKKTLIAYNDKLPSFFDADIIKSVYGYNFELEKFSDIKDVIKFDGSVIFVSNQNDIFNLNLTSNIDFFIDINPKLGSVLFVNGVRNESYISEIQHVRRRETIAMTPHNCLTALQNLTENYTETSQNDLKATKSSVLNSISSVTNSPTKALVGSSGLSIQYAILMGLIDNALKTHKGKDIKIVVPSNCYGGTNDQAKRVADCLVNVEVVDFAVDRDNDMVESIDCVLSEIAKEGEVPFIIAEIPTNPRVEVPNLNNLIDVLSKKRTTENGDAAVDPVFILDQTFCPNVRFLGNSDVFSTVKTISYVSGSKFPSGGKCTAGYCVGNKKSAYLINKIEKHLFLCDNKATDLQYEILAKHMPSMNQRIADAYKNTREFATYIQEVFPEAKVNFISEKLAYEGFTPSVFSIDLPTKGNTDEEREVYKRALNLKLINLMITKIPNESKYCVSYGQLSGCYWTIPATSTQGTTQESDKDYIVRVSLSPTMDVELHKKVFLDFVKSIE